MGIATGIIIFFLSLLALVAEIILYFIFGLGAALSHGISTMPALAVFFVCVMVLTLATGIFAPLSAFVELLVKKPNISYYIMLPVLGVVFAGLIGFAAFSIRAQTQASGSIAVSEQANESKGGHSKLDTADETRAYLSNIDIKNLRVEKTILNRHGVFGEVKNTGGRALSEVEIRSIFSIERAKPSSKRLTTQCAYQPSASTIRNL